jgi:micrococcal nuclease
MKLEIKNKKALIGFLLIIGYIIYLFFSGDTFNQDVVNMITGEESTKTAYPTSIVATQASVVYADTTNKAALKKQNAELVESIVNLPDCIPTQQGVKAYVVRAVDGDTAEVLINGETFRVRYVGINTPEYDEFYGSEATAYNKKLLEGEEVMLYRDVTDTDQYGRLLRYIMLDDIFVNAELVAKGYADAREYDPDNSCDVFMAQQEEYPRTHSIGMWSK